MPNALKVTAVGADPLASDVAQLANLFNAALEAGLMQLSGPQSTPAAPTVADAAVAGNLNGPYLWKVVLVTGWKQSDGSYYVSGFAPSADSASLSLTNSQASLSNIGTGTIVVIGRAVYRTAAGGAAGTEKFAAIIWDNGTTTWTDNVADASLGTGMPSSSSSPAAYGTAIPASVPATNTTGTSLSGTIDATSLGGILAANFIRGDSGAPNPQTVANPVNFGSYIQTGGSSPANGNYLSSVFLWFQGATTTSGLPNGAIGLFYDTAGYAHFNTGLATDGPITSSAGQLGSASGTWTPASGSLNVAIGTVINVAAVPTGAKSLTVQSTSGYSPNFTWVGSMTTSGFFGMNLDAAQSYGRSFWTDAISSTTLFGAAVTMGVADGSYVTAGYFQISGGYLQFVTTGAPAANTTSAEVVRWAVN
jgi:hypothetical protein